MDYRTIYHHWRTIIITGLILLACLATWLTFTAQIKSVFRPRVIEIKNNSTGRPQATQIITDTDTAPAILDFWPFNNKPAGAVNFLLLGAPGQGNEAPDLTDAILLARLDSGKNKIYLFSLPRDFWVKIPGSDNYAKLNALYAFNKNNQGHEFDALTQKVQDIAGLPIDHYVFVDMQTVKQLVDIFGGVNIMVEKDIKDTAFPGPGRSFQTFEIKAGWRYLDGDTALKYIRTRHSTGGDFDRVARQQEVLRALKQKVLALNFLDIGKFLEMYSALSSNIKSDLNLWEIKNYWEQIKNIPGENVIKTELDNQTLLANGQINMGGEIASIIHPKAGIGNYNEIQKYIANIVSN